MAIDALHGRREEEKRKAWHLVSRALPSGWGFGWGDDHVDVILRAESPGLN